MDNIHPFFCTFQKQQYMEMGITCQKLSNIKVYFAIPVSWHPSVPIYQHSLIALDPLLPLFKMMDARNGTVHCTRKVDFPFNSNHSDLLLSLCAAWQAFPDPVISLNMNLIDERKGRQSEVNRNLSSKAQKRHPPTSMLVAQLVRNI